MLSSPTPDADQGQTHDGVGSVIVEASPLIHSYISLINQKNQAAQTNQPKVEVNEVVGMWAFAYEKLRNSVEYREESVLLRGAITRILKRRLNPLWQFESTASALVRELIWARYLPNDSVPQSKVEEIEQLLAKYSVLRQTVVGHKQSEEWQSWILGIAACDIERILLDKTASYALAEVMLQWLRQALELPDMAEDDRDIQLYLAIHRTLLKSDATLLSYHLFTIDVPEWGQASEEQALDVARRLPEIRQTITEQLEHSAAAAMARIVKKQVPPFLVLNDIVSQSPPLALGTLTDPQLLRKKVEEICGQRYSDIQKRIRTAIVRSMIYILITKAGLALLLEIPFDNYFYGQVHWPQIAFNILFPPLFMAGLGLSIKAPGAANTEVIYNRLLRIVAGHPEVEVAMVTKKASRASWFLSMVFFVISMFTFLVVASLLWQFDFTVLGIGLFLFFFCVVVFFTYRVRRISREMQVVRQRENIIEGWITVLTLPFLALGYRLSSEFGKVNILTFILDVLLEAPFKFILDLAESWIGFVRAKREEVMERQDY